MHNTKTLRLSVSSAPHSTKLLLVKGSCQSNARNMLLVPRTLAQQFSSCNECVLSKLQSPLHSLNPRNAGQGLSPPVHPLSNEYQLLGKQLQVGVSVLSRWNLKKAGDRVNDAADRLLVTSHCCTTQPGAEVIKDKARWSTNS